MSMTPQIEDNIEIIDEEVASQNRNHGASRPMSSLNATITRISRPMTAYYNTRQGPPISALSMLPSTSRLQSAVPRPP